MHLSRTTRYSHVFYYRAQTQTCLELSLERHLGVLVLEGDFACLRDKKCLLPQKPQKT